MNDLQLASPESTTLTLPVNHIPPDRHPALVYLASLGAGSRRTMTEALNTIASMLTGGRADYRQLRWAALRYEHSTFIRAALMERYRPATTNKFLAALRGVLREAWRLGYTTADEYQRASDIRSIKAQTLPRGRALSSGEIAALMRTCIDDASAAGARDAALIACLYGAGLRRSEAVALDTSSHNAENGELRITGAKGRKVRRKSCGENAATPAAAPRLRRMWRTD